MIRTGPPRDFGGKFFVNCALTEPVVPCGRVMRPQIARNFEPFFKALAL
jgi:hypothetical protein